jgi:hypothetical protein
MIPSDYYDYTRSRESGGDPNARNPLSSATGDNQFIESTWDDLRSKYPNLGLTPDGRTDPEQSKKAMKAFTEDNHAALTDAGYEPQTNQDLYMAHRFGASGAIKAFAADQTSPAADIFGPKVMKANPDLEGKTIADLRGAPTSPVQLASNDPQQAIPASRRQPLNSTVGTAPIADGSLSNRLLAGGPGALFGAPGGVFTTNEGKPGYDLGSAMQGAGAGLISINDPKAGLGAMAAMNPTGRFTTTYDKDSGKTFQLDTHTGRTTVSATPGWRSPEKLAAEKKSGEDWITKDTAISDEAGKANNGLAKLDLLEKLLKPGSDAVYQGPNGSMVDTVRRTMDAMGIKTYPGMGKADAIKALTSEELGIARQTNGVQRMTNAEIPVLSLQTAGLNQSSEGNTRIINSHRYNLQLEVDAQKAAAEYRATHDGMLDRGFQPVLDALRQATLQRFKDQGAAIPGTPSNVGTRPPLSSFQK